VLVGALLFAALDSLPVDGDRSTAAGEAPPSPVGRTIEGFPEYAHGSRVVQAERAALPQRTVTVAIAAPAYPVAVFERCELTSADATALLVETRVNGNLLGRGRCGEAHEVSAADATRYGAMLRESSQIRVTLTVIGAWADRDGRRQPVPVPTAGFIAVAVGQPMLVEDYPFPPRPPSLAPLPSLGDDAVAGLIRLRAVPGAPNEPVTVRLSWRLVREIRMVAQTPGSLYLHFSGATVASAHWWDYDQRVYRTPGDASDLWPHRHALPLSPGEGVTVTIVPARMTGAWEVVLATEGRR